LTQLHVFSVFAVFHGFHGYHRFGLFFHDFRQFFVPGKREKARISLGNSSDPGQLSDGYREGKTCFAAAATVVSASCFPKRHPNAVPTALRSIQIYDQSELVLGTCCEPCLLSESRVHFSDRS
jgi:hypothetical protein